MYRPTFKTKRNGVPILSKNELEIIAENVLREFCPDALINPQAIDVEGFIEMYLRLKVDYQYLSNDGRYLGMMVFNDTDRVIIFDPEKRQADYMHADARTVLIDNSLLEESQEHRYRYTMAHEGGHDILHGAYYAYNPNQISIFDVGDALPMVQCRINSFSASGSKAWTDEDWMEWQANYFSAAFLMPASMVRKAIANVKVKQPMLKEMAMVQKVSKTFNVSPEAAKYRLEELKCIGAGKLGDVGFLNSGIVFLST